MELNAHDYARWTAMMLCVRVMHQRFAKDVEHVTMYGSVTEGFHLTHWRGKNNAGEYAVRNIYSFTDNIGRQW